MPKYKNDFEKEIGAKLKKLKLPFSYESRKLPYTLQGNYNPDFNLGDSTIVEGKGLFRAADRRKMVAIRKAYPDIRIILCFYDPYKRLDKRSKTTYAQWAIKNGFEWCTLETLKDTLHAK